MAKENTEHEYVAMPHIRQDGICLNNQSAGNLIKYLQHFPADARVVITAADREGNYQNYDAQIACNFEHQEKTQTVQLVLGFVK